MAPQFSIITPSYNQFDWLKLCSASIADQSNVTVEHIVQDAGTGKDLEEWAAAQPRIKLYLEKDSGMYDAVNRGLKRAAGRILAYLNCDEQYLPNALSSVAAAFQRDQKIDVLLAGTVVVNREGQYICSRPALKPRLSDLRAGRMYNLTSSIFFRANFIRKNDLFFNSDLRIVGDLDWLRRVMEARGHVGTLNLFTSTFADLGTNLALTATGLKEVEAATMPRKISDGFRTPPQSFRTVCEGFSRATTGVDLSAIPSTH